MHDDLRKLDLNLLVALEALLHEKHVSRAAERLGLGQPAMSRILGRIRDMFSDELLVRGKGGFILTERAEELLPRLQITLDQVRSLMDVGDFLPQNSTRTFSLRATHYVMQTYLLNIVKQFLSEAPNATLVIDDLKAHDLEGEQNTNSDLAIISRGINVPESFMQKKLGQDQFMCVMGKEHPLANKTLTLEAYLSFPHAVVSLGGGRRTPVDDALQELQVKRRPILHVANGLAALEMLSGSDMVMTTTTCQVQQYADRFGLVMKKLPFDFPDAEYRMAWHPVQQGNSAHGWFRKLVYREMRKAFLKGGNTTL